MSKLDCILYEVQSSWWAGYISWPWAQRLAGKYYRQKAERKYARLQRAWAGRAVANVVRKLGI